MAYFLPSSKHFWVLDGQCVFNKDCLDGVAIVDVHWKALRQIKDRFLQKCSVTHGLYLTQRHPARKRIGGHAQCKQTWQEHERPLIWTSRVLLSCFHWVNPSMSHLDSKMWHKTCFGGVVFAEWCNLRNRHNVFLCFDRSCGSMQPVTLRLCASCFHAHRNIQSITLIVLYRKIDEWSLERWCVYLQCLL